MRQVVVLGASGMLGSMVVDVLSRDRGLEVVAVVRDKRLAAAGRQRVPKVGWQTFDVDKWNGSAPLRFLTAQPYVINCIGLTKQVIQEDRPGDVERAIRVNALFPYFMAAAVRRAGGRMIQIATDCVYSGHQGNYTETDPHDAVDVYGKTKSLGETRQEGVAHLRCSIVGPEPKEHKFLLEWFLRQPQGAQVRGFVNHRWNGITTLHFARICLAAITTGVALRALQHVVPAGTVTKADMLHHFARAYARHDIHIADVETAETVDRTLTTDQPLVNVELWRHAGYPAPPTVPAMIDELSRFEYRLADLVPLEHPS